MKRVVKKSFICITLLIIFLASVIPIISLGSTPSVNGHSADNILITLNNYKMTLQYAINNNFLTDYKNIPNANQPNIPTIINGHDNLYTISITNPNSKGFCPPATLPSADNINVGHSPSEISVMIGTIPKTLQEAINGRDFCPTTTLKWVFLGGSAGCQSQYVDCPCQLPHVNCKSCATIGAQCKVCAGAWTNKYECREIYI